MKPSSIRGGYTDTLAQKRRTKFLFKIALILFSVIITLGGIFYLLFFRNLADIRAITFEGLNTINSEELKGQIAERLDSKYFRYIPRKNNLFLLNADNLKSEILSKYPNLYSLEIEKNMPHELKFKFKERVSAGIWCFYNNDCIYFDSEGNMWGPATKSSGFLVTTVHDKRKSEHPKIEEEYFKKIKLLLDNNIKMPFTIKNIIIPENSFRDITIETDSEYDIMMSLDSNILEQLEILKVFLNDKDENFRPKYLDLRIDGRVYYK